MRRPLDVSGYESRLFAYVLATIVVGVPVAAGAAFQAASSGRSAEKLIGIAVFFLFALFAELRPVPVDIDGQRLVSLANVFVIASQLLFGWEWSVLIGAAAIAVALVSTRPGPLKILFNGAVYAIAAGIASLPNYLAHLHAGDLGYAELAAIVFASGALFVCTNVVLVCVAMAFATGTPVREVVWDHLRHSGPPFLIMAFIAAQVVIFWDLSPVLVSLVSAPLFTLNLYQRSAVRGRVATRASKTDNLTGLKNHRAYEEEIEIALTEAVAAGEPLTLCLIDVDRFKQVNDRYGHPAGDAVLKALGDLLESVAPFRGYRIGGDELAVIVAEPPASAVERMSRLQAELAETRFDGIPEPVTISSGIATFPEHAADLAELKKHADLALYRSKRTGKDRFSIYDGEPPLEPSSEAPLDDTSRDARLRTAEKLVAVVDVRDAYVGEHSGAVARLVEAMGRTLGLREEELKQLRLAGLLHDLGKIAVPDSILNKPGALDEAELELMRTHPQVAFDLLDGLDLAPVDTWILHHHEHWDGSGYPHGLAGAEIPFGSRLILVADAFEAMTTDRCYRRAISVEAAMAELHEKAGAQFDPLVVSALEAHLTASRSEAAPNEISALTWSS